MVAGVDVVAVYRDWAEIQSFLDEHSNTRLLAQHLFEPVTADVPDWCQTWPLPIDRWGGHTPLMPLTMTSQSVASVVRAHLIGPQGLCTARCRSEHHSRIWIGGTS